MSDKTRYEAKDITNILHNFEAVGVVAVENIRSHECKYWHNIMKHRVWSESGKVCH